MYREMTTNLERLDKYWCLALLTDKNYSVLVVKCVLIKKSVGPAVITAYVIVNS